MIKQLIVAVLLSILALPVNAMTVEDKAQYLATVGCLSQLFGDANNYEWAGAEYTKLIAENVNAETAQMVRDQLIVFLAFSKKWEKAGNTACQAALIDKYVLKQRDTEHQAMYEVFSEAAEVTKYNEPVEYAAKEPWEQIRPYVLENYKTWPERITKEVYKYMLRATFHAPMRSVRK